MADLKCFILLAMAASIEALFRIFGSPDQSVRRMPLSMDKYYHATCGTRKEQLGLVVDSHEMLVELPESKREKILQQLQHWHNGRKSFTLLQAAQLIGALEHAATVAPWLRYCYDSLRHSLLQALRHNASTTCQRRDLRPYLLDMSYKGSSHEGLLKKNFATSVVSKKIWNSRHRHFISPMLASEIAFLQKIFSSRNRYRLYTPISYLVHRTPDYFARGDACLDGAGGFCLGLKFWWFYPWPQAITKLTLKHFRTRVRIEPTKFISINLLEYITIILTYAGAIEALRQLPPSQTVTYPLLELASDNTSAVAWTKKAVLSNNIGKRLAQVHSKRDSHN